MAGEPGRYLAYMLRLWQVGGEGGSLWRASLESPHTGERQAFACLEDLFRFLQRQTGALPASPDQETERTPGAPA